MMAQGTEIRSDEQFIATVNTWELHHYDWPVFRVFARHYVDQLELDWYIQELLSTRDWEEVHAIPHLEQDGHRSDHVFDIYGRPTTRA